IERRHDGVADQEDIVRGHCRLQKRLLAQQPGTDADRVGAIFELYGECLHMSALSGRESITLGALGLRVSALMSAKYELGDRAHPLAGGGGGVIGDRLVQRFAN